MRLLVLTSSYPTATHPVASAFLQDWVGALVDLGHSVTVSTPGHHIASDGALGNGSPVVSFFHYLPWPRLQTLAYGAGMYDNVYRNPLRLFQLPLFLGCQFRHARHLTRQADLVHAHWMFPAGLVGAVLKRQTGTPLVVTIHSTDLHLLRSVPGGAAVARFVARHADRLHFVSDRHRQRFEQWLDLDDSGSYVVPMGVPEAFILRPPVALRASPRVGFLGRLIPIKGVDRLLRACAALRLPEVLIAGDGPSKAALVEEAKTLQLKASFVGPLQGIAKLNFIDSCDVLVFPSRHYPTGRSEGLPVSLLESLARGRVALASDSGGIPEIIRHGDNGFLFDSEQEGALRVMLAGVLARWDESREVGLRARRSVMNWSASAVARQHESVYRASIKTGARQPQ